MKTVKSVALAVATFAAVAAVGQAAAAEKIVVSNLDSYMPKDLLAKFKAETGIEVEVAVHATNEEIMGKVVASAARAMMCCSYPRPSPKRSTSSGIAAKLDHSKIPNLANLYPEANSLQARSRQHISRFPMPGARPGSAIAPIW